MMFHPTRTIQSDRDIQETCLVRFPRLWALAERMDWDRRWPCWFWRWLLRKCDEANGYNFEHLEDMHKNYGVRFEHLEGE